MPQVQVGVHQDPQALPLCWDASLLSWEEGILEYYPALLGPSSLQGPGTLLGIDHPRAELSAFQLSSSIKGNPTPQPPSLSSLKSLCPFTAVPQPSEPPCPNSVLPQDCGPAAVPRSPVPCAFVIPRAACIHKDNSGAVSYLQDKREAAT